MNINQEQKDLLIEVLEKTINDLDMGESMEFGEDINHLKEEAEKIEVKK